MGRERGLLRSTTVGRRRGLLRKYNCGEREGTTEEVQLWGEGGDY